MKKYFKDYLETFYGNEKNSEPQYEIGEVFVVDNLFMPFLFVLTGEVEENNMLAGYKMVENADLSSPQDMVVEFRGEKCTILMEHELFVPKTQDMHYIGMLAEPEIDILYDHEVLDEPIPESYKGKETGRHVDMFKQLEYREVRKFIALKMSNL